VHHLEQMLMIVLLHCIGRVGRQLLHGLQNSTWKGIPPFHGLPNGEQGTGIGQSLYAGPDKIDDNQVFFVEVLSNFSKGRVESEFNRTRTLAYVSKVLVRAEHVHYYSRVTA
jgi:hypothetical protein